MLIANDWCCVYQLAAIFSYFKNKQTTSLSCSQSMPMASTVKLLHGFRSKGDKGQVGHTGYTLDTRDRKERWERKGTWEREGRKAAKV